MPEPWPGPLSPRGQATRCSRLNHLGVTCSTHNYAQSPTAYPRVAITVHTHTHMITSGRVTHYVCRCSNLLHTVLTTLIITRSHTYTYLPCHIHKYTDTLPYSISHKLTQENTQNTHLFSHIHILPYSSHEDTHLHMHAESDAHTHTQPQSHTTTHRLTPAHMWTLTQSHTRS